MARQIARLLICFALAVAPSAIGNSSFQYIHIIQFEEYFMISKYDGLIKSAAEKHLPPGYDWRLFKAQLWQESRLDPDAVSPAGAVGIGQFMAPTWAEEAPRAGFPGADRTDPRASIFTAAHYMAKLIESWYVERPDADRYCLAMASYNAGFGNLLKAQRLMGGKPLYADIIPGLPKVTALNSLETINYVREIMAYCAGQITGEIINE